MVSNAVLVPTGYLRGRILAGLWAVFVASVLALTFGIHQRANAVLSVGVR